MINRNEKDGSYSPGVFDAGDGPRDGPSGDMTYTNVSDKLSKDTDESVDMELGENCLVVVPFRPPTGHCMCSRC